MSDERLVEPLTSAVEHADEDGFEVVGLTGRGWEATLLPQANMTEPSEPFEPGWRALRGADWDVGFTDLARSPRFGVRSAETELSVSFGNSYRYSQVFSPRATEFVCFEPMTAPSNALISGVPGLSIVGSDQRYKATFEIAVEVRFAAGEELRTEISAKVTRPRLARDLAACGLELAACFRTPASCTPSCWPTVPSEASPSPQARAAS